MRRLFFGLCLAACGEAAPDATPFDAGSARDTGSVDANPGLVVRVEVADGLGSDALLGDPLDLVVLPSGAPAVVYGAVPVGSVRRELRYAERRGADDWAVETMLVPGRDAPAQGELLAVSAAVWDGTVHATYLGGDDNQNPLTPYPTDLMLATRGPGGWTERRLVQTSGEAVGTCPDSQNYCNTGNVVGSHAAIAAGGDGFAVAYRDTHLGFAEDDLRRSDVEMYRSPGGPVLIDPERGGGAWSNVAYLPDGRVAVAYQIEAFQSGASARGIWAAVELEGSFLPIQVAEAATTHRIGLDAGPDGTVWLAWFDAGARDLVVAHAESPYRDFRVERVDLSGVTGLHPDLAVDGAGQVHVVYGYCGDVADRNCPGNPGSRAEVRLARRDPESGTWRIDRVDDGEGRGGVGFYNRLAFLPDGGLAVAFQDVRNNDVIVALVEVRR